MNLKPAIFIDVDVAVISLTRCQVLADVARGLLHNRPHENAFIARNISQDNGYLIAFAEPQSLPSLIVAVVAGPSGLHGDIETVFQRP